jgi:hypothetical protein
LDATKRLALPSKVRLRWAACLPPAHPACPKLSWCCLDVVLRDLHKTRRNGHFRTTQRRVRLFRPCTSLEARCTLVLPLRSVQRQRHGTTARTCPAPRPLVLAPRTWKRNEPGAAFVWKFWANFCSLKLATAVFSCVKKV